MDWILLLVWITLISSYNCRHHGHDYPHYGYGGFSRYDYENYGPPLRRSDHESYASEENERISPRSAERVFERPRQNERSIAVDSEVQRVQDQERKRLQDRKRVDDSVPRTENGSSKIVHLPVLTNRGGQIEERPSSEDSFVFPGPTAKRQYVPEVPESCQSMQICDNVPNYPTELAARIIADLGEKRDKFTVDQIDPEIEQRVGTSNIELCRYKEEVMIPQAAPSKDGEWYFVLNDVKNPLQGYRVEICNNTGGACDNGIAIFNKKYHATCRQKYVQRFMTVIDKAGEVKYDMPFRVPSCCSCVATYNGK